MKIVDVEPIIKYGTPNRVCLHCCGKANYKIKYVFESCGDIRNNVSDEFYLCNGCLIEWRKKFSKGVIDEMEVAL